MAEVIANSPTPGVSAQLTTLGAAITTTGQTAITTSAAATGNLLNGNFRVLFGDGVQNSGAYEIALVTAGQSGTSWTVTRAVENSTAYTWNNATPIYHVWTQQGLALGVSAATRQDQRLAALGLQGASYDPSLGYNGGAGGTISSGFAYAALCGFEAGDVITNVWVAVDTVASGTAPTGIYMAVYAGGTGSVARLGVTANLASSSIWTTAQTAVSGALSSPYTVSASGGLYLAILQNGVFGTTALKLVKTGGLPPAFYATSGLSLPLGVSNSGGATVFTNPMTLNASGGGWSVWFGWS